MSDLQRYISKRAQRDPEFAEGFEEGYTNFKLGMLLRQAREDAGLTQEDIARMLKTRTSAISKMENNAEEMRLSLLRQYARVLGKDFYVSIA